MTPTDLAMLLHFYSTTGMYPSQNTREVFESVDRLRKEGLITFVKGSSYCVITDMGKALVQAMCNTPYPRQVWVDHLGNKIEEV